MALHFPGAFVVTIAPTLVVIFSSLLSGGETLKNYVMDFAGGGFAHTHPILFLCAKSVFVLLKDGIFYCIVLRNNGFRWSLWHVDNHSVLLVLDGPFG